MCLTSLFLFFQIVKVTTFEVTTELIPHGLVLRKLVPKHVSSLPLEMFEFGDFKREIVGFRAFTLHKKSYP